MPLIPGPIRAYLRKHITAKGEIAIGTAAKAFAMLGISGASDGWVLKVKAANATGWEVGSVPTPTNVILKATLSAKGSMVGASGAATPVNHPAGADDEVIVYDSGQASGLLNKSLSAAGALVKSLFTAKGSLLVSTAAGTPAELPLAPEGATLTPRDEETAGIGWQPGFGRSAHILSSTSGPFDLEPAEEIDFAWSSDEGDDSQTVTFDAAAAQLTSASGETFNLDTLVLETDKGNVTFVGNGLTAAQASTQIQAQTTGLTAADDGGGLVELTTTQRGTGAVLNVTGGTANAVLSFSTISVNGTGDVVDIDAVTAEEVSNAINSSGASNLAARVRDDGLVEAYIDGGRSPSTRIIAESTSTATAIGFDNDYHHGSGAAVPTIIGTQSEPFAPVGGETLVLRRDLDSGTDVTVTLQAGDTSAALVAARINGTPSVSPEITASDDGGKVKLVSNSGGTESNLSIPSGTAKTILGFDGNDTDDGDDGTYDSEALGGDGGGGGGLFEEPVTGAISLTGSDSIHARIDSISGDFTIDLPSASESSGDPVQEILISDASNTAGENGIVKIARDGTDTILIPGVGEVTALTLGKNGASVRLVSDGSSQWSIVERDGVGVDVRTISGLEADWDSSRGFTLTGQGYSELLDQSGNGNTLAQGTDVDRLPQIVGPDGRLGCVNDGSDNLKTVSPYPIPASNAFAVFLVADISWGTDMVGYVLSIGTWAAASGNAITISGTVSPKHTFHMSSNGYSSGNTNQTAYSPHGANVGAGQNSAGCIMWQMSATEREIRWNDRLMAIHTDNAGTPDFGAAVAPRETMMCGKGVSYRLVTFDGSLSRANQLLVHDALTQAYPFVGR